MFMFRRHCTTLCAIYISIKLQKPKMIFYVFLLLLGEKYHQTNINEYKTHKIKKFNLVSMCNINSIFIFILKKCHRYVTMNFGAFHKSLKDVLTLVGNIVVICNIISNSLFCIWVLRWCIYYCQCSARGLYIKR